MTSNKTNAVPVENPKICNITTTTTTTMRIRIQQRLLPIAAWTASFILIQYASWMPTASSFLYSGCGPMQQQRRRCSSTVSFLIAPPATTTTLLIDLLSSTNFAVTNNEMTISSQLSPSSRMNHGYAESFTSSFQQPQSVLERGIQDWSSTMTVATATATVDTTTSTATTTLLSAAATKVTPPTNTEIALLRQALATFYNKDALAGDVKTLQQAESLLTQTIQAWQRQPPDEQASLYRVRGDCYMALLQPMQAEQDYTTTLDLLRLDAKDGDPLADPSELPTALLGRARAVRSQSRLVVGDGGGGGSTTTATTTTVTPVAKWKQAATDYQTAIRLFATLGSGYDDDNDNDAMEVKEQEQVGVLKNPYAAWEWGSSLRGANMWNDAARVHQLAASAFETLGDHARSVISQLDAGIDLAAAAAADGKNNKQQASNTSQQQPSAQSVLTKAIDLTTSVEGRDVALLQRVIAKEGEARIALASLLWNAGDRQAAESQLGTACLRLEQLEADATNRQSTTTTSTTSTTTTSTTTTTSVVASPLSAEGDNNQKKTITKDDHKLKFSIDDGPGAFDISCSKFRSESFLTQTLQWPDALQQKVFKLQNLSL